jgi:hypothetical protein
MCNGGGESRGKGREDWLDSRTAWIDEPAERIYLINIEVKGGAAGLDIKPIVIEDRGGELNDQFIRLLTGAYCARKWAYRAVRRSPDRAS